MSDESEETVLPIDYQRVIEDYVKDISPEQWEDVLGQLKRKINEAAVHSEGMNSLTDKEIADHLRETAPYLIDRIYRDIQRGSGSPISTSDITPSPLPMKFMTRALSLGVSEIVLNFSGGSDEGMLNIDFRADDGSYKYSYHEGNEELRHLESEVEDWAWGTVTYGGAGDGSSYGDIVRYKLKEGTVTTEAWWTEEVHGGETSDTMETC